MEHVDLDAKSGEFNCGFHVTSGGDPPVDDNDVRNYGGFGSEAGIVDSVVGVVGEVAAVY